MIIRCVCIHNDQDRLHGLGLRVANYMKKDPDKVRCTSCKAEIYFRSSNKQAEVTQTDKKKKK